MSIQEKLVSTVDAGSSPALDLLKTSAEAASADSTIEQAEIQQSLSNLLQTLASNASIKENDKVKQLIEASPAAKEFIVKLQESIFNYKASTPQGLLLKDSLNSGSITESQFQSLIKAIVITPSQAQSSVSGVLAFEIQKLLLTIVNDTELKTLITIVSSSKPSLPVKGGHFADSNKNDKDNVDVITDGELATTGFKASETPKMMSNAPVKTADVVAIETSEKGDPILGFFANMIDVARKAAARNLEASKASLLTLKAQPRIMTGARAVVKINGEVAALCTNVSYDISMDWSEIKGIDELIPSDMAPNAFSVKGSMTLYRMPNKSPVKDYLSQDMFSGIIWPYSTIEIKDKRTDEIIVLIKRAVITSRAESFSHGQLTSTTMSFIGVSFRDEAVPQLLPDELAGTGVGGMLDRVKKFFK